MKRKAIIWGSVFGFLGIAFGAMAAHALKGVLAAPQLHAFTTGVRFQIYHALLLLIIGFNVDKLSAKNMNIIINLLITGIFCFSFSIYLLSMIQVTGWTFLKIFGPITPLGGLLLMTSWILLGVSAIMAKKEK